VTCCVALVTAVALVVLAGCGTLPRREAGEAAASPAASPTPSPGPPAMVFAIRADRTLVVRGGTPSVCRPDVKMVYVASPRVLQVLLADDAQDDCNRPAHDPDPRRSPVRFRIPAGIDLDSARYVDLVGPLAASPRFRLHNALARRPV
jgi:hypothetical protein